MIRGAMLLMFLFAGQASAQEKDPGHSEIVIEGNRNRDQQIRQFVDALTKAPVTGQLSRFDEFAVCPAVVGLSRSQNDAVTTRMRQVAKAAGIAVAEANCRPNALVLVTSNKEELIAALRKGHPAYFKNGLGDQIKIDSEPGPATAWHIEGLLDADGTPVPIQPATEYGPGGFYAVEMTTVPSRLTATSRPQFASSVVVVELQALAGLTTTQLADYAAMRTYARTDPSRLMQSTAPTILTVLDAPMGSSVPVTLTQWDLSFLKALYSSDENQFARRQRGQIQKLVRKDLNRAHSRVDN